jgi:hypothetical protein
MFTSLESICEEFGFHKNLSKSKLRNELKKRITSIHADKTGGEFPTEAVKQLYLRMREAMEYLDNQQKINALEKRNSTESALEVRITALEASNNAKGPTYEESAQRTGRSAGEQYRGGWISSGVFAAACGAILLYSRKISENPLLSPFIALLWVRLLIPAALVLSALGFAIMRIKELKLRRKVSALLSDDGIAWVVRQCINKYNEEPDRAITKRKMMDAIGKCGMRWHKSKVIRWLQERFRVRVPRELAEKIAKLQLSSLVERGVVCREGTLGIEPVYMVEASLAKEILEDHGAMFFEHELP